MLQVGAVLSIGIAVPLNKRCITHIAGPENWSWSEFNVRSQLLAFVCKVSEEADGLLVERVEVLDIRAIGFGEAKIKFNLDIHSLLGRFADVIC